MNLTEEEKKIIKDIESMVNKLRELDLALKAIECQQDMELGNYIKKQILLLKYTYKFYNGLKEINKTWNTNILLNDHILHNVNNNDDEEDSLKSKVITIPESYKDFEIIIKLSYKLTLNLDELKTKFSNKAQIMRVINICLCCILAISSIVYLILLLNIPALNLIFAAHVAGLTLVFLMPILLCLLDMWLTNFYNKFDTDYHFLNIIQEATKIENKDADDISRLIENKTVEEPTKVLHAIHCTFFKDLPETLTKLESIRNSNDLIAHTG